MFDKKLVPAFNKSALNVVQIVLDGRNFLYNWIYSHHTVCYYSRLLSEAIKQLSRLLSPPEDTDRLLDVLFSAESFEKPVPVGNSLLYLPSDGDIFYLLKQRHNDIKEIGELLSRQPRLVPLWKTFAEFELIFENKGDTKQRESIRAKVKEILHEVITDTSHLQAITTLQVKPEGRLLLSIKANCMCPCVTLLFHMSASLHHLQSKKISHTFLFSFRERRPILLRLVFPL